ncbi:hypothetical protein ACROYT_G027697 [Oculina patagonica]
MAEAKDTDIDAIDDIVEMSEKMKALGVPSKGLRTLDEMKERVKETLKMSRKKSSWTAKEIPHSHFPCDPDGSGHYSDNVPHSNFPCGADGSGYYSDNTLCCYKVIYEAAPLVLDAIKLATVKPGSVFTIADYGCADGGTSMPLLYACVQELRKIHGDDLPISVIYEDQPVNDFKSLFLRLQVKAADKTPVMAAHAARGTLTGKPTTVTAVPRLEAERTLDKPPIEIAE